MMSNGEEINRARLAAAHLALLLPPARRLRFRLRFRGLPPSPSHMTRQTSTGQKPSNSLPSSRATRFLLLSPVSRAKRLFAWPFSLQDGLPVGLHDPLSSYALCRFRLSKIEAAEGSRGVASKSWYRPDCRVIYLCSVPRP